MRNSKSVLRKTVVLFLSVLMLFGNLTVTVKAEGALTTNKGEYLVNEPILVTATEGKWVGVYKKDDVPSDSVLCFYRFDVDGETHNIFNETNGGRVPSSIPSSLGYADVILFGDEGYDSEIERVTIHISKNMDPTVLQVNPVNVEGESIFVTATSNLRDAWVGIYEGTYNADTFTVDEPAIETFFVANNNNEGKTLETSLTPGKYYRVMFSRKGTANPPTYNVVRDMIVSFQVISADFDMLLDRDEYYLDNSVMVTTTGYVENGWVGLYEKGAEFDPENGGVTPLYQYALTAEQPQVQDILKGTANRPEDYKIGEYTVVAFGGAGYSNVLATADYKVIGEVEPALSADKESYKMNEPIIVSAKGGAWVGIYKKGDDLSAVQYFYSFEVDGETHNILKETNGGRVPATVPSTINYADIILFGSEGTDNILKKITVAISGAKEPSVLTVNPVYEFGEEVFVTATSNERDAWVGLYKGTYDAGTYSVNDEAIEKFFVANYDNEGKSLGNSLEPGCYYLVMTKRSGTANPPKYLVDKYINFEVNYDEPTRLWIDHGDQEVVEYKANEPVMVTATSKHVTAWVGLYDYLQPDGSDVDLINGLYYWFLVHDFDEPVNIFETTKGPNTAEIKAGKYKVIIFEASSGYDIDFDAAKTENSRAIFAFNINEMYDVPVWTWNENGTATATFTSINSDGIKTLDAEVTETIVTPAACGKAGEKKLTATVTVDFDTVDGKTEYTTETTQTIPASEHDWSEWKVIKAPTCTEAGTEERECSVCGEKETRTIDALGHTWSEWKQTKAPTCTEPGEETRECSVCHEKETRTVEALGHTPGEPVKENEVAATCAKEGSYDEVVYCLVCHEELSRTHKTVEALEHTPAAHVRENEVAVTCTTDGSFDDVVYCSVCGAELSRMPIVVKALGHDYGEWKYDGEEAKTHTHVCANDNSHKETEPCTFDEGITVDGVTIYTCKVCGGTYTVKEEGPVKPVVSGITRVYGSNRFGTSFAIAETIMMNRSTDKLDSVILANGDNFADALAGSYLAAVKNAPIIITRAAKVSEVNAYIKSVLNKGGTIYVLGGTAAVPESSLNGLSGYKIKRLAGNNRYGTNLEILKEAGVDGDTILIATGINYADSLSASATGLPMLLVKGQDSLNDDQIKFLKANPNKKLIILGGESAVSSNFEKELRKYGEVSRIAGDNRFATSIKIAEYFFNEATTAVLAYGSDFPDGLCGGPLAYQVGAPLILTRNDKTDITRPYTKARNITDGYALGGTSVLPDATVRRLFGAADSVEINEIKK